MNHFLSRVRRIRRGSGVLVNSKAPGETSYGGHALNKRGEEKKVNRKFKPECITGTGQTPGRHKK